MARLPVLRHLLLDCTGSKIKDWFYYAAIFVSTTGLICSAASLISFCIDYSRGAPVYHVMPRAWHIAFYVTSLTLAILAALPPLIFSLLAIHSIDYENHKTKSWAASLCRVKKFENFYCLAGITRCLLLFTLSASTIVLANMLSIVAIHLGSVSLFGDHWTDRLSSIDSLQRHYACCGLRGYTDWQTSVGKMPVSCSLSGHIPAHRGNANTTTTTSATAESAVKVRRYGCRSLITAEPVILQSIDSMLAFVGVLLLASIWFRMERVAGLTNQDLRDATFSKPRHSGQAAAFVQSHRARSTGGLPIVGSPSDDSRDHRSSNPSTMAEPDRPVSYHRRNMGSSPSSSLSSGFLHAEHATRNDDEDDTIPGVNAADGAAAELFKPLWRNSNKNNNNYSDSDEGDDDNREEEEEEEEKVGPSQVLASNGSNNSALQDLRLMLPTAEGGSVSGWQGARIVNSLLACQPQPPRPRPRPSDSARLVDETTPTAMKATITQSGSAAVKHPPAQLSAGDLLAQSRRSNRGQVESKDKSPRRWVQGNFRTAVVTGGCCWPVVDAVDTAFKTAASAQLTRLSLLRRSRKAAD